MDKTECLFLGLQNPRKTGDTNGSPPSRSLLGPRFGIQIWTQKWVSHERILLLPAEILQADLRRTSMSVSVNTCFFSLCVHFVLVQSRSFSGRHASTGFLDPVFGSHDEAGLLHSRRSKAYRGLPEARMAGATAAFEDVYMWQALVSQKPHLMNVAVPSLGGET